MDAWKTFEKIRGDVVLAVFDDVNLQDLKGREFVKGTGLPHWHSADLLYGRFARMEGRIGISGPLALLGPLDKLEKGKKKLQFHGGMNRLHTMHLSFVQGGKWQWHCN